MCRCNVCLLYLDAQTYYCTIQYSRYLPTIQWEAQSQSRYFVSYYFHTQLEFSVSKIESKSCSHHYYHRARMRPMWILKWYVGAILKFSFHVSKINSLYSAFKPKTYASTEFAAFVLSLRFPFVTVQIMNLILSVRSSFDRPIDHLLLFVQVGTSLLLIINYFLNHTCIPLFLITARQTHIHRFGLLANEPNWQQQKISWKPKLLITSSINQVFLFPPYFPTKSYLAYRIS